MKRILMVEDNSDIAFGVNDYLARKGFVVEQAASIEQAEQLVENNEPYWLCLLDWNLPDGTGDAFLPWLKARQDIPVIFITVRDDESDMVKGLDIGADDYIVKPFTLGVLYSRINAVLRRQQAPPSGDILRCADVTLEPAATRAWRNGEPLELTAGEYRLLLVLLQHKDQTLTRNTLLERLWDVDGAFVNDNTLTVTVKRLREKLGGGEWIKTVRGIGYRAEDEA